MPDGDGEWTFATLKVYLEAEIRALREYHDQSVDSQHRLVDQALRATTKSIEKSERQMTDRMDRMVEAYQSAHKSLVDAVDSMNTRLDRSEGSRSGANQFWLVIVAAISTIGVIVWTIVLITGR